MANQQVQNYVAVQGLPRGEEGVLPKNTMSANATVTVT